MEKKKLLLVAISVGVFLVLTIGAAILVFTPKNTNLPFETIASNINPETITVFSPSSYQSPIAGSEQGAAQPSSIDAVDLVRNPGGVPGLITPPEGAVYPAYETGRSTESVISVLQPSTAAVPNTAPAGRAVNESAPAVAARPAQTTTPAQTASTPAKTTTTPAQATSTPAQTTTSPSQTASTPAKTTTPAQTASAQTTATPAATPVASTASQSIPAAQTKIYDDYWVQTGAFSTIATAEGVKETLASKGITSIIENGNVNGRTLFRVRVGPYTSRNEANYWLALIKSIDGFEDSQVRTTENLR
jgi:DedD protein